MLKGRTLLRRRKVQEEMALAIQKLKPDILVLQEFSDESLSSVSHNEALNVFTNDKLKFSSYGFNASTKRGQHGNALVTHFPILTSENFNISKTRWAQRGVLRCTLDISKSKKPLNILCTHLDLFQKAREQQVDELVDMILQHVKDNDPVVLCGDFNDWNKKLDRRLHEALSSHGRAFKGNEDLIKTYPSPLPVLPLDRIYLRGLELNKIWTPKIDKVWSKLSDHLPLIADCSI